MKIDNVVKNAISGVQSSLAEARNASSQLALGTGGEDGKEAADSSKAGEVAKTVKSSVPELGNLVDVEA